MNSFLLTGIPEEHMDWVVDYVNQCSDITYTEDVQENNPNLWRIHLVSDDCLVLYSVTAFIVKRLKELTYLKQCIGKSTGGLYWVSFSVRTLLMIMRNSLKKVLKIFI